MAISDHRKFLPLPLDANQTGSSSCYFVCSAKECSLSCISSSPLPPLRYLPPAPPLPLPPTTLVIDDVSKHQIHPAWFVMIGLLSAFFVLFTCFFIIVKFCPCCDGSGRRSALSRQEQEDTHSDFLDEDQGPVMDNPFWYINTVGLDRSIINSIAMFKYKRGDGLVEGTECSVCLGEFREDETLRLLPKCSHAFHVSCIDTWLRSHTNCPLCRARVVSNPVGSSSTAIVPVLNSSNPGEEEETRVENSEIDGNQSRGDEDEACDPVDLALDDEELQDRRRIGDNRSKEGMPLPPSKSEFRVLSDLADNLRVLESGLQPVRRSVSMDFSSASIFCFSVANNSLMVEAQGSSAAQFEFGDKSNNLVINHKRPGVNPFLLRLKGTSPIGRSLQKSPLSMKRSVSSGSKVSSSRHARNRSFLLPL